MKQVFWGLIGIVLSYLMIRYRKQIVDWTGKFAWAETYLGSGGTYNAMVLLSLGLFIFSLLYMTGSLDSVLGGFVGLFAGGNKT